MILNASHDLMAVDAFSPRAGIRVSERASSSYSYTSHPFRDDEFKKFRPPIHSNLNSNSNKNSNVGLLHVLQNVNVNVNVIHSNSRTSLHMATTKSGGRPIMSERQFQLEVLQESDDEEEEVEYEYELDDDLDEDDDEEEEENDDEDDGHDEEDRISSSSSSSSSAAEFEPLDLPTLVLYSAPWCGPCRLSNPVVKEIVKEFVPSKIIDVVEVCTDDLPEVAEMAGVVSIPTMQIYYRGELLDTIVGCVAKNVLMSAITKILEDLDLVEFVDDDEEEAVVGVDDSQE